MPTGLKQKIFRVREQIKPVKKTAENPYFKSKYFDINILVSEVMPLLQKELVLLTQPLVTIDGKSAVKTSLWDIESDEVIESTVFLPDGLDAQKMGSAITYLRRYSLQSLLCLEAEDDDGNSASKDIKKNLYPTRKSTVTIIPDEPDGSPFKS